MDRYASRYFLVVAVVAACLAAASLMLPADDAGTSGWTALIMATFAAAFLAIGATTDMIRQKPRMR